MGVWGQSPWSEGQGEEAREAESLLDFERPKGSGIICQTDYIRQHVFTLIKSAIFV